MTPMTPIKLSISDDFNWNLSFGKASYTDSTVGLRIEGTGAERGITDFTSEPIGPDCLNNPDLCGDGFSIEFEKHGK